MAEAPPAHKEAPRRVVDRDPRGSYLSRAPPGSCPGPPRSRTVHPQKVSMFASIARAIFGTANDRSLKAYQRRVPQINALEPAMEALSDEALRAKTDEFRA